MQILFAFILVLFSISLGNFNGTVLVCGEQMWNPGSLELVTLPSKNRTVLDSAPCYGAIFSPQGTRVAYIKNNRICIINNNGLNEIQLKTVVQVESGIFLTWININGKDYIYFSTPNNDSNIYRIDIDNSDSVETIFKSHLGAVSGLRVSKDGQRAAWTKYDSKWINQVVGLDFSVGTENTFGAYPDNPGCNGCISPSGEFVTHCLNSHIVANIHPFENPNSIYTTIEDSTLFSLIRFSTKSDSFAVYSAEDWSKGSFVYNTILKTKDSVGIGEAFDFWPGSLPLPPVSTTTMVLSSDALSFVKKDTFQATPSSIIINCKNAAPHTTLSGLKIISFPPWLIISIDSTDINSQLIKVSINGGCSLTQGTYSARIVIESNNSFPSKTSFMVNYTIGTTNAAEKITISTSSNKLKYGDTVIVNATVLSINGDTLRNCPVIWELSTAETIDSLGRYICKATALGPIYIIGTAGNISDTDTVNVVFVKPAYSFIQPEQTDTIQIGDSLLLAWESRDDIEDAVFEVSPNDGKAWYIINGNGAIKKQSSDWGKFFWVIPNVLGSDSLSGKKLTIKIREYAGPEYSISPYKITISPNNNPVRYLNRNFEKSQYLHLLINSRKYIFNFAKPRVLYFFNLQGVCIKKIDPVNFENGFFLPRGSYLLKLENDEKSRYSTILVP